MKKGFSFIECILAITILGIIAISILPVIDTSFKQFEEVQLKNDLRNVAQSTIEILKSRDPLSHKIINELEGKDEIEIKEDYIDEKYNCIVKKHYNSDTLMEVEVVVINTNQQEVREIALKASIKK